MLVVTRSTGDSRRGATTNSSTRDVCQPHPLLLWAAVSKMIRQGSCTLSDSRERGAHGVRAWAGCRTPHWAACTTTDSTPSQDKYRNNIRMSLLPAAWSLTYRPAGSGATRVRLPTRAPVPCTLPRRLQLCAGLNRHAWCWKLGVQVTSFRCTAVCVVMPCLTVRYGAMRYQNGINGIRVKLQTRLCWIMPG